MVEDEETNAVVATSPRAPRKAMMLAATLTDGVGVGHKFRVRNLSATGLGGVIEAPLAAGDAVRLDLPGIGTVGGTVSRVRGRKFGVRFQGGIAPELVSVKIENEGSGFVLRDLHKKIEDQRRPGLGKW